MRSLRTATLVFTLALASITPACGDLSNEDLQFEAVLPDDNLAVALPSSSSEALNVTDTASPTDTAGLIALELNAVAHGIVHRARTVASHRPALREKGKRVWGPFKVTGYAGYARLTMTTDSTVTCDVADDPLAPGATGYRWVIDVSRESGGTFSTLTSGTIRGADFSHSCGTVTFDTTVSRAVGGTETDDDPTAVHATWTRSGEATNVVITVDPSPSGIGPLVENTTYDFRGTGTRYGHFAFAVRYFDHGALHVLDSLLRWGPGGRPWRADSEIKLSNGTALSHGVSCGPAFGDTTFLRPGVPPATPIDTSADASCSFDYGPAN
jgi:hypothetical protein